MTASFRHARVGPGQNGYVVHDIRSAMEYWINVMGVGPCEPLGR